MCQAERKLFKRKMWTCEKGRLPGELTTQQTHSSNLNQEGDGSKVFNTHTEVNYHRQNAGKRTCLQHRSDHNKSGTH